MCRYERLLPGLLLLVWASGCASFTPPRESRHEYLQRAVTRSQGDVSVSAVVLTDHEAKQVFGSKLAGSDIQPVWVSIDNKLDEELLVMLIALDPNYISPSEAAWRSSGPFERGVRKKMNFFSKKQLPMLARPGKHTEGYVFTNSDPGMKAFNVQLIGDQESYSFSFAQMIPGLQTDFNASQAVINAEHKTDKPNLSRRELRKYLEKLPSTVFGGDGKTPGDPLNIVIVGKSRLGLATFSKQGWDPTETLRLGTAFRTVLSSIFGMSYRTSPVSPLMLFDRKQDYALQKARKNVNERNHFRVWRAPVDCEGEPVWVGQISRDIGVKLNSRTLVTHVIDPEVDEARDYLLQDLLLSSAVQATGYVKGVGVSSRKNPRKNFTHDPYVTDGLRVVLFLTSNPTPTDEIDWLDWEWPTVPDARE
ncbi:MAG: LssY C-terminal domain-containing protein [Chthoniobacterales bacterium]